MPEEENVDLYGGLLTIGILLSQEDYVRLKGIYLCVCEKFDYPNCFECFLEDCLFIGAVPHIMENALAFLSRKEED